ncbi:hypothetical protein [Solicola sp. PLA-1-18]|uniref:hypothetical protein n=1 Tax=Solicola sp. PLA-1-18 TaxID=3380532 RepID=UPI003B8143C6
MGVWGTEELVTASSPSRRSVARERSGRRRIWAAALVMAVASAGLATTAPASATPVAARSAASTQLGQPKAQGIPGVTGTTASVVFGVKSTSTKRRIPTKARVDLLGSARPVSLGKVQLPGIASG